MKILSHCTVGTTFSHLRSHSSFLPSFNFTLFTFFLFFFIFISNFTYLNCPSYLPFSFYFYYPFFSFPISTTSLSFSSLPFSFSTLSFPLISPLISLSSHFLILFFPPHSLFPFSLSPVSSCPYLPFARYSPIGIASIIAGKLLEVESFAMLVEEVGLYVVTVLVGLVVHGCIVLPLIYFLLTRQNPLKMVRAALQALLTAFGTSSRCVGGVVQVPMIAEMGMWFGSYNYIFMLPKRVKFY